MAIPQIAEGPFTYADYRHWPEDERWELIDGEAYAMSPAPSISHQKLVLDLARQIADVLDGSPCQTLIAPLDVLLPTLDEADEQVDTIVQPDILVVCDPAKIGESRVRGAPDWIIEVLSPSTARHDHLTKRSLYERAGVREYWLVHPIDRVVTLYTLHDGQYGRPEIVDMAGEFAPAIFPELLIHWQRIVDKLPDNTPPSQPSPA